MNKWHPDWEAKGQGQGNFRNENKIICSSQSHTTESVATQIILLTFGITEENVL